MTTTETTQFTEVTIKMRLGVAKDFSKEIGSLGPNGEFQITKVPKYGQPYWLRSQTTGKFDNRNYQITEDTDWPEFKDYLRREMVYIPAGYFELIEKEGV